MTYKKQKIIWAIGFTPNKMGSFEKTIIFMAQEVKNRGSEIAFVFPGEPIPEVKKKLNKLNAEVFVIPIKHRLDVGFMRKINSLLKQKNIDILHSHFDLVNFPIAIARLGYSKPLYFWQQHNLAGVRLPLLRKLFYQHLGRVADRVIIVSKAVKEDLVSKGLNEKITKVLYNAIDLERFNNIPPSEINSVKEEFDIDNNTTVVGCIAQARPEKGHTFLLRAFSKIKDRFPNLRLLLAGANSGESSKTLKDEALALGIDNRVIFTDMRNDIPAILSITDFVVIPSTLDGLSYSALEAMASRKAVIAARVGGLPEVIFDGETGILTPPGDVEALKDSIVELTTNVEKRNKITETAYSFIQDFDIRKMVNRIFTLYNQG